MSGHWFDYFHPGTSNQGEKMGPCSVWHQRFVGQKDKALYFLLKRWTDD